MKRKLGSKLGVTIVGVLSVTTLGALVFYFVSSAPSARSTPTPSAAYNPWAQTAANETRPAKTAPPTARPTKTAEPLVASSEAPETGVDWHYIDPASEEAIKLLLNTSPPELGSPKAVLPPPPQFVPGVYNPLGPATIGLDAFSFFLQQAKSPAAPEAAKLYQNCLKLYCDPAVALAFFEHESSMGKAGVATENKSWGNIRCTAGSVCRATSNNGSFKAYPTWTDGLIDWAILLRETYATKWKLFSLEQIIPRYAPSSDNNNPTGYIATVKKLADKYRNWRG
jgi:hypothetical protein